MRLPRLIAVALAAAGLVACGSSDGDPCAFTAFGAPWLAFTAAQGGSAWQVQIIRADGTCRRGVGDAQVFNGNPAWGRGSLLAYESDRTPGTGVWLHDVAKGTERRLDLGDRQAMQPAITPDGTTLVFEGRTVGSTTTSIWSAPLAGGAPVELTPEAVPHVNLGPAVSPDGGSLYFVSNRSGAYEIYRLPIAGGFDPEKITTGSGILGRPAVSPDGRTLAYARYGTSLSEVVLLDLASRQVTPLGVPSASEPAFDPAGGRLAIRAYHGSAATIDFVTLATTVLTSLTGAPGNAGSPAFAR